MKASTIILAPIILAAGALAQGEGSFTCLGDIFDDVCCENGLFSGPVYQSFEQSLFSAGGARTSSLSSAGAARSSSLSDAASSRSASQDSLRASVSSDFAFPTNGAEGAMVTARAVLAGRAITTEVKPGLTCIGDGVSSQSAGTTINTGGSGTSMASSMATAAGSAATSMTSNPAPMMTQAPMLLAGVAVAMAYGAM
ncbi:hypothetical protein LSUE1_G001681 [Lachnellula suecica]|uniref:Uncharacterized protein n=1 Tax=Lachnellula suecica TaxID=602035 RepID=A0A8T9CD63_9HELO|nr:hypothetical protein LSUE1_G001681 [Lachnellula suecica]